MCSFCNLSNCSSFDDLTPNENQILKELGYIMIDLAQKESENLFEKIYNHIIEYVKFLASYEEITSYLDLNDYNKINLQQISIEEIRSSNQNTNNNEQEIFQVLSNFFNLAIEIYTLNPSKELIKELTITSLRVKQKKPLVFFKTFFGDYAPLIKLEKFHAIEISQKIVNDCFDWVFYPQHTKLADKQITLSTDQLLSISQILDRQQKGKKEQKLESFLYYEQFKPDEDENKFNLEKQMTINTSNQFLKPATRTNSTDIRFLNRRFKARPESSIEQIRKEIASFDETELQNVLNENVEEEDYVNDDSNNQSREDSQKFVSS